MIAKLQDLQCGSCFDLGLAVSILVLSHCSLGIGLLTVNSVLNESSIRFTLTCKTAYNKIIVQTAYNHNIIIIYCYNRVG